MAKSRPITASPPVEPDAINPFDLPAAASPAPDAPPPAVELSEPATRTPRKSAASAAPADPVIAAMQSQIDHLQRLVETLVANHNVAPAAPVKPAHDDAEWKTRVAAMSRTTEERSQDVVNELYPRRPEDKLYDVQLLDKPERRANGEDVRVAGVFPRLRIPADRESDARGRYQEVCGIISTGDAAWSVSPVAA